MSCKGKRQRREDGEGRIDFECKKFQGSFNNSSHNFTEKMFTVGEEWLKLMLSI